MTNNTSNSFGHCTAMLASPRGADPQFRSYVGFRAAVYDLDVFQSISVIELALADVAGDINTSFSVYAETTATERPESYHGDDYGYADGGYCSVRDQDRGYVTGR